ncbi:MAG: UDP-N-acetylmuramoyl-tripeptide--D-alanyl-D-alanine ligase [Coriobacteriaceae bacterium]|nr:UDP-N-acetylmuramoyl-tripeptide--D-alanyl-D-alanine ligase [Coriobacteriaceae bacterium]
MVEIAVKYLESTTGARCVQGDPDRVCRGVAIDSRAVEPDAIFVAFPGERVDGAAFAPQAIEAGAGAVVLACEPSDELLESARERGCAVLTCDDPTEFLLRLAQGYRARMQCTVIGVTGSIGKTTTKDVLASLLAKRYRVHATAGNYNNLIGLPLTILSAPADTQMLVLEMGMNSFGEISRLTACAQPTFSIITKVGTSHIGMLGSRENIARAKAEIIEGMPPSAQNFEGHHSALILHGEDDFTPFIIQNFARPAGVDVVLAGTSLDDDVSAANIELDEEGCATFDITFEDGSSFKTRLSVPGAQAVPNALFAAAVAHRLGIPGFEINEAFGALQMTGRRVEVRRARCGARVIDDSYNASPESMAAGLNLLCSLPCEGSRIAILGEIGELGDEAGRMHDLIGAYAAAKPLSLLVCVGGASAERMASAARLMGMDEGDVVVVPTCDELIDRFAATLGERDLVLVKGSRFVGLDRFAEEVCADAR